MAGDDAAQFWIDRCRAGGKQVVDRFDAGDQVAEIVAAVIFDSPLVRQRCCGRS